MNYFISIQSLNTDIIKEVFTLIQNLKGSKDSIQAIFLMNEAVLLAEEELFQKIPVYLCPSSLKKFSASQPEEHQKIAGFGFFIEQTKSADRAITF